MIKLIPIALVLILCACSGGDWTQSEAQQRIAKENPEAYYAVESVCPGLRWYESDMTFTKYHTQDFYEPKKHTFTYRVSEEFSRWDWLAAGHNCFYQVNSDYSMVIVDKRGCISICLDERSDESTVKLSVPKQ